jgi:hypothetical protein
MEILIIGGIVVVIMVIVSTTIKKHAAAAYQAETVEKETFRIEKPDGFLYPMRDEPDFPFEAYSKLYGERSTRNIWQARARLRIMEGLDLAKIVAEIKTGEGENFVSEKNCADLPAGQKGVIVRSEKTVDEIDYKVLRKIIESADRNQTYELRTTIMEPYGADYTDRACGMMKSFVVK